MTTFNRNDICSVQYLWIDGNCYQAQIKSKARCLSLPKIPNIKDFPRWNFDGNLSAQGDNEELYLVPVRQYINPLRSGRSYIILCEVTDATGLTHSGCHRAGLRMLLENSNIKSHRAWLGFGQHYCLGTAESAVGDADLASDKIETDLIKARIAEAHASLCLEAGLKLHSWHLSSHLDHWIFKVGSRNNEDQSNPLVMADDLWIARYFLDQIARQYALNVIYDSLVTPASLSVSCSTAKTRQSITGIAEILRIISVLESLEIIDRNTNEFKRQFYRSEYFTPGYTSRQSAFRLPPKVVTERHGYFVDQRPRATADPYRVAQYLLDSLLVSEVSSERRSRLHNNAEIRV